MNRVKNCCSLEKCLKLKLGSVVSPVIQANGRLAFEKLAVCRTHYLVTQNPICEVEPVVKVKNCDDSELI